MKGRRRLAGSLLVVLVLSVSALIFAGQFLGSLNPSQTDAERGQDVPEASAEPPAMLATVADARHRETVNAEVHIRDSAECVQPRVLSVVVVDSIDRPISDARVEIMSSGRCIGSGTSNRKGLFEFRALIQPPLRVVIQHARYCTVEQLLPDQEVCQIRMIAKMGFEGMVLAEGEGVSGARVVVRDPQTSAVLVDTWSSKGGRFLAAFPPDSCKFPVLHAVKLQVGSFMSRIDLESVGFVEATLQGPGVLVGQLLDRAGTAIAGASLIAISHKIFIETGAKMGSWPAKVGLSDRGDGCMYSETMTDSQGRFRLSGLSKSEMFTVVLPDGKTVCGPYDPTSSDLITIVNEIRQYAVLVVDDTGRPMAGAHVACLSADRGAVFASGVTASDGKARFSANVSGPFDVEVNHEGMTARIHVANTPGYGTDVYEVALR